MHLCPAPPSLFEEETEETKERQLCPVGVNEIKKMRGGGEEWEDARRRAEVGGEVKGERAMSLSKAPSWGEVRRARQRDTEEVWPEMNARSDLLTFSSSVLPQLTCDPPPRSYLHILGILVRF